MRKISRRLRAPAAALFVAVIVIGQAVPASADAGDPDTTFGGDGKVRTDFAGTFDMAVDLAIQPNGRIVAVGHATTGKTFFDYDFGVARYLTNGDADSSFSGDGKQMVDFGGTADVAVGVALPGDGTIVVGGTTTAEGSSGRFAAARLRVGGALDPTFSGDGKVRTPFPGYDSANAGDVAVQDDGKILVVGGVRMGAHRGVPLPSDFGIVRYKQGGALDGSFGGDGRVTTDFAGDIDTAQRVLVMPSGGILVAGQSNQGLGDTRIALAMYHPNGTLDDGFSGDGKRLINLVVDREESVLGMAVRDDGRIVIGVTAVNAVSATSDWDFGAVLLNANGTNATSFGGGDGIAFVDYGGIEQPSTMARDPNGKLYFAGTRPQAGELPYAIQVFRLNASGAKSTTFGDEGMTAIEFGTEASGTCVVVDGSHRPVVAGRVDDGDLTDFAVVRLEA